MINLLHKLYYLLFSFILFSSIIKAEETPDYDREQNINEQITRYVFDSDIIELSNNLEDKFNIISSFNSSDNSILLLHGRGLHPTEPNVINPLRLDLLEGDHNIYSLQLPVLEKGKTYNDYYKIFRYSDARILSAINHIESKNIIIISHSCGAHMLLSFINNNSIKNISGIIMLGAGAVDKNQNILNDVDLSEHQVPILNIYGEYDHGSVKAFADDLKIKFLLESNNLLKTIEVKGADHNYEDQTYILIESVKQWLKSL
tara:strand:+ start:65 stop:841 length:777 start_codon:yes stop_codon:yes gene_type:complete